MYSPTNDLQKMWLVPHYIYFKVDIAGQHHYGRIKSAIAEPFDVILKGRFEAYNSLWAAQSGSPGMEIVVGPKEIIGLEAYDILSNAKPSPFSRILSACETFDMIKVICEDTPTTLQDLIDAIEDFTEEHPEAAEDTYIAINRIEQLRSKYANEEFNEGNAKSMKEQVSLIIQNMFRMLA